MFEKRAAKKFQSAAMTVELQSSSSSDRDDNAILRPEQRKTISGGWSKRKLLFVAGAVAALVLIAVVVPTAYCLTGSGRCGKKASSTNPTSTSTPTVSATPTGPTPGNYPTATVAPLVKNANPMVVQGFEWYIPRDGKHWDRLKNMLPALHQIGVSNLWIPPPTKAATNGSIGYDVYDLWDLGEFNTSGRIATALGNMSQLLDLSTAAHLEGIGMVVDGVMNHRAGAEFRDECTITALNNSNRLQAVSPSRVAHVWTGFNFTARKGRYSNKTWGCDDFTGVDWDDDAQEHGLFKINDADNDFEKDVSPENGNYDYLSFTDVAFRNPSVRADVIAWGVWITDLLGLSGFRIDAGKHISQGFLEQWITTITSRYPGYSMLFAAEYWDIDTPSLSSFLEGTNYKSSAFDVALLNKFNQLANATNADITVLLKNDTLSTVASANAVTFVANHDTQPGQSSDSLRVFEWFKPMAYAFTLLRSQGYPCVFYGDLVGTFDANNTFTKPTAPHVIGALAVARTYFAYGPQHDYSNTGSNLVGWTREGSASYSSGKGLAVAMGNSGKTGTLNMFVGTAHSGEQWIDILGNTATSTTIGTDGFGVFGAPSGNVSVFVEQNAWKKTAFDPLSWTLNPYTI